MKHAKKATPKYKKGDTHSFFNRYGVSAMLVIEGEPRFSKGFSEPSYVISIDGKKVRGGMPEGIIERLIAGKGPTDENGTER